MQAPANTKHSLGLFALVMIAIVSVDSLRNLPIGAQYGFALVTFYLIAGLTFFLPLAWVTSKLTAQYPTTGGSYVWIKTAFGKPIGILSIWLQWIYNMIWYPTIFTFISSIFVTLIHPGWENNTWFILSLSCGFFWLLSLLHCFGIRISSWISTAGAIIGTLLPMLLLIGLGIYWLGSGSPSATPMHWHALLPTADHLKNLAFFSNILFSLLGLEVIAMHAGNVKNPQRTYPRALGLSTLLILFTLICSSLSLCIILPAEKIALISGLMDVFKLFFSAHHWPSGVKLIAICIILGGLAIASSWMIGLARGLHVALCANHAPLWLQHLNKNHAPVSVLLLQAVVYSVLLGAFLFFPDINHFYWVLSALTAQFALLYYVLLFCAAMKLLQQNRLCRFILPGIACFICLFGIIIGFFPPEQLAVQDKLRYELLMGIGFIMIGLLPIFFSQKLKHEARHK